MPDEDVPVSLTPEFETATQKITIARRPVGKPALSPEQKAQREATIDTHMNLPVSIVEKIDRLRCSRESRKDWIVRIIREYPDQYL